MSMSAGHVTVLSVTCVLVCATIPAGFQYIAVAPSATAVYALPIPTALAETPIFRN